MSKPRLHWLAGLAGDKSPETEAVQLDPGCPIDEAWKTVQEHYRFDSKEITQLVAGAFRLEVADIGAAQPTATKLLPATVARKALVFPLRDNYRELVVATCDPTALDIEQAIAFSAGRDVVFEVAAPVPISNAISTAYGSDDEVDNFFSGFDEADGETVGVVEEDEVDEIGREEADAAPVIKLVNLIIRDAVEQGASDIHIQPSGREGIVRFRVDGMLRNYMKMPDVALVRVISRIKVISKLDIAVRLRPQDGKVRVKVASKNFDLRVSTVPAKASEKAVIRILDTEGTPELESIGYTKEQLVGLREVLSVREGIILVTGPTGSGKTTTLYAVLRDLSDDEVNIMTVEDPIEYELEGITQIQVQEKQGVTFASALRAILRQDPDIVLVGEIRDLETAEMAVQASLTGHLVLATLHTNDAIASVQRLVDVGLNRASIADALRGVAAQRLVRRICSACAIDTNGVFTPEEQLLIERQGVKPAKRAAGCDQCGGSGYRGRAPIVEVVAFDKALCAAVAEGQSTTQLAKMERDRGGKDLRDSALQLVARGITSLEEVERVLGGRAEEDQAPVEAQPKTVEVADVDDATIAATLAAPVGDVMDQPVPEHPRALVVDDDSTTRSIVKALLENEGMKVDEAVDGLDAIRLLKADPLYDVMVLDLDMPNLDGRDVLKIARASPGTAHLPILVLTGTPDVDAESQLLELGADEYIRKPIAAQKFMPRFRALLRRTAQ